MKERVGRLVGGVVRGMWVSTFHSACVRILRRDAPMLGYTSGFSIYDDIDARRLVEWCVRDLDLDPKRFPPKSIRAAISNAKNELVDFETFARAGQWHLPREGLGCLPPVSAAPPRGVGDGLRRLADGDRRAVRSLSQGAGALPGPVPLHPGGRVPGHQPRPVPAGADCSPPGIATCASSATPTRASTPSAAPTSATSWNSSATIPTPRVIVLDRNYRSTQTILDAANAVIANNPGRKPKHLWTDLGEGVADHGVSRPRTSTTRPPSSPNGWGRSRTSRPVESDVAVFYRTHAQSRVIEEVFVRYGVPYQVIGGPKFYDRREIKDVIAYLKAIVNPADDGGDEADHQRAQAWHRRHLDRAPGSRRRSRADHLL